MWKDLFSFNRAERRGVWILSILMSVSLIMNALFPLLLQPGQDFVMQHEEQIKSLALMFLDEKTTEPESELVKMPLQNFNPNHIDPERFETYGLTRSQAQTLFRYTKAGGRFRSPSDLSRIRNLSEADIQRIRPYLVFPDDKQSKAIPDASFKRNRIPDLNSTDTVQLENLPGIGSVLAKRIIKYREALGGFSSPEQLREIYGMQSVAPKIIPFVDIDTLKIKKLDLLTDSFKTLVRHPYLDADQVKMIMKARKDSPHLLTQDSIAHLLQLSEEMTGKIRPYIK